MTTDETLINSIEEYSPDSFLWDIHRGRQGFNQGLNNGLGRANEFLHGFQQATYYLMGAESGVGKTTFADYSQILCPHYDAIKRGIDKQDIYFSWEISKRKKKLRFATTLMTQAYKVRLPYSYILSKGKFRCSDEHWELCKRIEPEVEKIFSRIQMIESPMNSRQVIKALKDFVLKYGKFIVVQMQDEHGDAYERIVGYTPNDPNRVLHAQFDHLSLADNDPGATLKQTMDNISKAIVWFRNICGISGTVIQQFGSDMQSTDRRKLDKTEIAPMRSDFGDSKYTYRDADVVWGLISPDMFGFMDYREYDISRLRTAYIHAFLMKNRDGFNGAYPLFMDPIAHTFEPMPKPALDLAGKLDSFYDRADMLRAELDKTDFSDQKPKFK